MRAESPAYTRSQHIISSMPPASARPFTAAITGLGNARTVSSNSTTRSRISASPGARVSLRFFRSAPAQNARPEPVSTTTRTLSSCSISRRWSSSASTRSKLRAFMASGRLNVSQQVAPSWRCSTQASVMFAALGWQIAVTEFAGGFAGPAFEGAGEIAGVGKAQQIRDFADGCVAIRHVLDRQILTGLVQNILIAGIEQAEFMLQVAR